MTSNIPVFTMRELMEAGVHFGHDKRRWNPKMSKYIFGTRDGVHIIDLQQTVPLLSNALKAVKETAARGGKILFVGTKRAASGQIKSAAERCGQHYVNLRWLGGMLTNWKTVSQSVKRLKEIEAREEKGEFEGLTKKEKQSILREKDKLIKSLGGIKDMGGRPDLVFVIDAPKEDLAIAEAKRLGIPVIAVLDSNADPEGIAFPVPGNDDASKAIVLYCDLMARAVLAGIKEEMASAGVDLGAVAAPAETAVEETAEKGEE